MHARRLLTPLVEEEGAEELEESAGSHWLVLYLRVDAWHVAIAIWLGEGEQLAREDCCKLVAEAV